jgi:predicted phage terminase large subunit-like protein
MADSTKDLDALKYLIRLRAAEESFLGFVQLHHPNFALAPFQLKLIDALDKLEKGTLTNAKGDIVRSLMINMPPRHGKLLADSTPVLTTKGLKPHGELQVGDELFHPDGHTTKVVAVGEPSLAWVNVIFSNGARIKCHPNHEWTMKEANTRGPARVLETQYLMQLSPAVRRLYYMNSPKLPEKEYLPLFVKEEVFPPIGRIYVERLEYGSPEIGRCIQVDAPDGQYLAGRALIPTHNSFLASWLFPVYYLARNPRRAVLATSYNDTLANDFGRKTRSYAEEPCTSQAFTHFQVDPSTRATDFWMTTMGGQYAGVGMGGTTTGRPANMLLIDDPVRNRQDAESPTRRNTTWDFYSGSLMNRKEPLTLDVGQEEPIEIVILTRWHPDDLAGRLQDTEDWKEGRWHHIELPAIRPGKASSLLRSSLPKDDPEYMSAKDLNLIPIAERRVIRNAEEALWPERFNLETLKRMQRTNEREFAALYMQKPYIRGGNRIKANWWRYYEETPLYQDFQTIVIGMDTAFKTQSMNDYSVMLVAGLHNNGDIYVLDVIRGKWDYPSLKRVVTSVNVKYRGKGLRAFYIEDKASGQSLIQELRGTTGISIVPVKAVHDKISRADNVSSLIEGGIVLLPKEAPWLDAFLDEMASFPSGTNDDQVDAFVIAMDQLSRTSIGNQAMLNAPLELSNSLYQQVERATGGLSSMGSLNSMADRNKLFRWGD